MMAQRRAGGATLLVLVCLCGCDFSSLTALSDSFGGHLISVSISGDTLVAVGDTVRLRAAGSLDGLIGILSYDPVHDARWSSSYTKIAVGQPAPRSPDDTLFSMIIVRGVRPGRVTIQATARGYTGEHVLVVHRQLPPPSMDRSARALEPGGHDALLRSHESELNVVP